MKKIIYILVVLLAFISCVTQQNSTKSVNTSQEIPTELPPYIQLNGAYASTRTFEDTDTELTMYIRFISDTELICGVVEGSPEDTIDDVELVFTLEGIQIYEQFCLSKYSISDDIITVEPKKLDEDPYQLVPINNEGNKGFFRFISPGQVMMFIFKEFN